jgi:hypothetical protein
MNFMNFVYMNFGDLDHFYFVAVVTSDNSRSSIVFYAQFPLVKESTGNTPCRT